MAEVKRTSTNICNRTAQSSVPLSSRRHQTSKIEMNPNNMKKKTITILMIATMAASLPITAHAQFGPRAKGANLSGECTFAETTNTRGMPGMRILRHRDALGLTDPQIEQIQQLANQYRSAFESHRTAAQASRDALRQVMTETPYDEATLRRAIDAAQPFRMDGMLLQARFRAELNAILTEDQRTKLNSFDRKRGNPGEGRGFRPGKRNAEGRNLRGSAA
jgi:Spy/CpxP family protein refolding chaperone